MTGNVPVFMQVAWFVLHLAWQVEGFWVLLQVELHRASRAEHVVAS
jgi:hypothetical protein